MFILQVFYIYHLKFIFPSLKSSPRLRAFGISVGRASCRNLCSDLYTSLKAKAGDPGMGTITMVEIIIFFNGHINYTLSICHDYVRIYQRGTFWWCSGWWFGHFSFFHILGIIIPIDKLMFFRGVGQPPTSVDILALITGVHISHVPMGFPMGFPVVLSWFTIQILPFTSRLKPRATFVRRWATLSDAELRGEAWLFGPPYTLVPQLVS